MWRSGGEMCDPDKEVLDVCLFYMTGYQSVGFEVQI